MRIAVDCAGPLPPGVTRRLVAVLVNLTCRRVKFRAVASIAVRVVGDAEIRALNRRYRGKNKVTDVLSFATGDRRDFILPSAALRVRPLGDIAISLPQVRRQARAVGRPARDEFALMVVHGTLHLLGYDHETVRDEREMFGLQHDILIRARIL